MHSPGLIGKVYSAKDEPAIRKGTLLNGIVQLFFAFFPMLIGMCAFAAFPDLSNQELALPKAMKEMMPFGISALALSAIFAAEVSTCDTVLYMLATSLSKDLYQTFIKPDATDAELLSIDAKDYGCLRRIGHHHCLLSCKHHFGHGYFLFPHDSVPCGTIPFWPFYQEGFDEGSFPFGRFGRCRSHGPAPFQWGNGHRHPQRDKLWDSCGGPCHGLESIRIFS